MQTRVSLPFEETKERLKTVIENNGYTFAHEQKCDKGLAKMGYESTLYRVLFFGKLDEMREISKKHEVLIPFIPFKVAVYAEGDKTVVSFLNPYFMARLVKNDPEFFKQLGQWESDFQTMLDQMSTSTNS
jgi:uncharacterized protein (DUF302 family)